ncbi:MAG: corrinoid protein [Planctomycetes bacterium]|nr:corrinoid protein [Planctomycetota bacterium]
MADLEALADAIIKGDKDEAQRLTQECVDEGMAAEEILNGGLTAGMDVVGKKFKANEFYVPEVLIAARAMHAGMDIIEPLLAESDVQATGKVVIGTVKGDLHDIGKNLVTMMLQGGGFDVIDTGIDVSAEDFLQQAKENEADIVALSALLTTTMPQMKSVIEAIDESGIGVATMIGGAPVTQEYADEIGASGYAPDAASAVDTAKELVS